MKQYLLILVMLLVVACEAEQLDTNDNYEIKLISDKNLYHSGEIIYLTSEIYCPEEIKNATINHFGIYSGKYRLNKTEQVDLYKGKNFVFVEYKAPACYGCYGIKPGTYQINSEIINNEKIVENTYIEIEIRQ